ncbi:PTS sugar transporter [Lederbergia sp. NSJ-179]|uniref:PTS sugar transporter n=1 Tax=Lederbergia sp. NSJ-179 TaxID=2931402 RepID=UPI001FD0BB94|nr:PTS sugar transporter [Lederbergia sp. NSJ-179]MCJ7840943.1 PTS sugar transporter [Lederbergia sp. NSJ-179]
MKNIAILGSSGGNLYNLGGKDPEKLLKEIFIQCDSAGINIKAVQFIGAEVSMDMAKEHSKAGLYILKETKPTRIFEGTLTEVNDEANSIDSEMAQNIRDGKIDGLIAMSIDPEGTNKEAILAAVEKRIPVVGTGGTSMAITASKGANVISTSGTTGTSNRTRAVSFTSSLCKFWGIKYQPVIGGPSETKAGNPFKRINIRGIMMASLPAFIALALILALSKIPGLSGLGEVFDLLLQALPVVIAAIAAKQVSDLDEVSIVAGIIAGVLSIDGGIIGGMIGGIGAGLLVQFLFLKCVQWRFPMTTVNIVAGGFSGVLAGLLVFYLIGPLALMLGGYIKLIIEQVITFSPILAGAVAGLLIWPGILGGIYHAAILPIVLLEMEKSGNSFLGAVDMVSLVIVAAGINFANIIAPRDKGKAAIAAPGFMINLGFGTFVESAYPFMFSNKLVFGGALFSAGVGGALVGVFNVRGTAYLPSFVAPFASDNVVGFIISMIGAFVCSFVITIVANKMMRKKSVAVVEKGGTIGVE